MKRGLLFRFFRQIDGLLITSVCGLLFGLHTAMGAEGTSRDTVQGLVVTYPDTTEVAISTALKQPPASVSVRADVKPKRRSTADPDFLSALRYQIARNAVWDKNNCSPDQARASGLLALAGDALAPGMRDTQVAKELLEKAEKAFVCGSDLVTTDDLSRYYVLSGVLEVYLEESASARAYFRSALKVKPDVGGLDDAAPEVKVAFDSAKKGSSEREVSLPVSQEALELEELQLRVDGQRIEGANFTVSPGRHVVQLVRADGLAAGGSIVEVASKSVSPASEWLPAELRGPTAREVVGRLKLATDPQRLDSVTRKALDELRKAEKRPWLLVVVPATSSLPSHALWVVQGIDVQVVMLEKQSNSGIFSPSTPTPIPKPPAPSSRNIAKYLAWSFGACALVSGTLYGIGYVQSFTPGLSKSDKDIVLAEQYIGIAGSVVCLVGTVISGAAYVSAGKSQANLPANDTARHAHLPIHLYPTSSLAARSPALGLQMEITW